MKTYRSFLILGILLLFLQIMEAKAQELQQTIKGKITDQESYSELIGATVLVVGSDPLIGSATDINGEFRIDNVPIGRVTLLITSIGYKDRVLPNIEVSAGKEVFLKIAMEEHIEQLDEIVIKAKKNHSEINNEMVMVSARSFSVEETKRYAGSFNDPSRMVANFAGVQGNPEGNNHIAVRGNSPNTVQWRLDGIEIPNPNHFTEEGSSGGAINVLNSAMLTNSDFYTGAFAPGYGNVMGAVFDMQLRQGNQDKREYSISAGILGTDITVEGPFSKKGKSTYLANYRYSTLSILDQMGVVDFDGVPKYQDVSFKFRFPTNDAGVFTLFGLAGTSGIDEQIEDEETGKTLGKGKWGSKLGTVNLNHIYFFSPKSSLESYISLSQNGNSGSFREPVGDSEEFDETYYEDLTKYTWRANTTFNTKINARNTFRTGASYHRFYFSFNQRVRNDDDVVETWLEDKDNTGMIQGFASWKHKLNDKLSFTGGVHYSNFLLSQSQAIEPRISAKYKFDARQSIFAGVGLHSQMASLPVYYSKITEDGVSSQPNLALGLMKSIHYVLGYDRLITPNLYFKAEAYYQNLYDIPVENDATSTYSLLNAVSGYTNKSLVNRGTGTNYGLELTLERYFQNNFFFMTTGSFYQSKYTTLENMERDTRFNGNYVANGLFGKEFNVGDPAKKKVISINTTLVFSGGLRYTPINLEESQELGRTVFYEELAFTEKSEQVVKLDASISYRWNKRKTRQEIKLDIQNVTNNDAMISEYYNSLTNEIETSTQLPMFPVLMYTIQF